ncbi:hypothetical protein [Oricola indica]|uniref:hypothetical protein n=1 Tax=Oricola indica TaxID=2872591 RepID=UPI003CCBD1B6
MTLQEFKDLLNTIEPGSGAGVPCTIFADLFPPGVDDDKAKGAAYKVAQAYGLKIENRPDANSVWFYRERKVD